MRSEFTQVVAGVIFKDEQLLVCRRNKGKKQAGLWEFPGGKVEENESHSEALIREIKEELNLDIKVEKFLIKSTYEYTLANIQLWAYQCSYSKDMLILKDHDEAVWIPPSDLSLFQLAPADLPIAVYLLKTHKNER